MAGKITCESCGKQYAWKPELAGKRAKCKCGAVVKIPLEDPAMAPPPPPPVDDGPPPVPEGFESGYDVADEPPPPPPVPAGSAPAYRAPVSSGGGTVGKSVGGGGGGVKFTFNWQAALTVLGGLAIIAFGVFEYFDITKKEQAGVTRLFTGRRSGWLSLIYSIAGKWGVVALFVIVGVCMVGGGILVMLGKKAPSEE
jgi:hypothetical protein